MPKIALFSKVIKSKVKSTFTIETPNCLCFRIIPRVKEFLFGRSSSTKHSVTANKNSILNVREKRKLRDFRRPSRVTAHVINKNQKYSPRNLLHKIISNIENI